MRKNIFWMAGLTLCLMNTAMTCRHGQYDEEAKALEEQNKAAQKRESTTPGQAAKRFVGGVKQATYDTAKSLVHETVSVTKKSEEEASIEGGPREGSALDNTVKGVAKVATLGYADPKSYQIEEPQSGTDETTKIKFSF